MILKKFSLYLIETEEREDKSETYTSQRREYREDFRTAKSGDKRKDVTTRNNSIGVSPLLNID